MSIRRIPDRYLITRLYFFRESTIIDSVGDHDVSETLAYAEVKASVQPKTSDISYELAGVTHRQTHVARFNRFEDDTLRLIQPTDRALDKETGMSFMILAIKNWQAAQDSISDSHHISLILKNVTGQYDTTQFKTVTSKARIS
jgi:hypothetical protein